MSLVRVGGSVGHFDKFAGTSPYAGAQRGAKMGYWYANWLSKGQFRRIIRREVPFNQHSVVRSVPFGRTGSAPGRLTGSAPMGPEKAVRVLGDLPSASVYRRKTSRIY